MDYRSHRHITRAFSLLLLWMLSLLPLSLLLSGCDCCPMGKDDPLATEILDVRVEPNPVPVGRTTTFTAIIRDSTETGFVYTWSLPLEAVSTTEPRYTWTPMVEPGEYRLSVQIIREGPYKAVQHGFTVTVIEQ